jgi:hypothetical protein
VSYNKTPKALDIIPKAGFYIKYFYDKNGKFITKTFTKPEKVCIEKIKTLDPPFEMSFNLDGYLNLFSCNRNSTIDDYFKWFKTGDKVYAILDELDDYGDNQSYDAIEATVFRDSYNKIFLVQDEREGTYSSDQNYRQYGQYCWIIANGNDRRVCSDHVILAVKESNLNSGIISLSDSVNEYNFNGDKASSDYFKILDDSDFAVTIKVGDMLNTEFKKLSDIKRHREERKS